MEVEKVLLLEQGLNPYIEFRSREVEAEVSTYDGCDMLSCAVLYCTVLYCTVMSYAVP